MRRRRGNSPPIPEHLGPDVTLAQKKRLAMLAKMGIGPVAGHAEAAQGRANNAPSPPRGGSGGSVPPHQPVNRRALMLERERDLREAEERRQEQEEQEERERRTRQRPGAFASLGPVMPRQEEKEKSFPMPRMDIRISAETAETVRQQKVGSGGSTTPSTMIGSSSVVTAALVRDAGVMGGATASNSTLPPPPIHDGEEVRNGGEKRRKFTEAADQDSSSQDESAQPPPPEPPEAVQEAWRKERASRMASMRDQLQEDQRRKKKKKKRKRGSREEDDDEPDGGDEDDEDEPAGDSLLSPDGARHTDPSRAPRMYVENVKGKVSHDNKNLTDADLERRFGAGGNLLGAAGAMMSEEQAMAMIKREKSEKAAAAGSGLAASRRVQREAAEWHKEKVERQKANRGDNSPGRERMVLARRG